ncbi:MAG: 5'/3'-nucleotidase SurE [Sphingomonadales bacterium]
MRILVTNDDGIHADGLGVLEKIAGELSDDVWVVAPEAEQSGAGHSLTLNQPLRYVKLASRRYAVRGTPTDCVMMATNHIIQDGAPDLVLSGVNRGSNLGEDVTYSGTIAAAMEGTLAGVPSIALSQAVNVQEGRIDWAPAETFGASIVRDLLKEGWPETVLMNVNFPALGAESVKGIEVTHQGQRDVTDMRIEARHDMRGLPYYWFALSRALGAQPEDSDLQVVRDGFISVTPLHLNLTHEATRQRMEGTLSRRFENG